MVRGAMGISVCRSKYICSDSVWIGALSEEFTFDVHGHFLQHTVVVVVR